MLFSYDNNIRKFYGIYIFNKLTGTYRLINKFEHIDKANKLFELIKGNPTNYVNEDGDYIVETKIILESDPSISVLAFGTQPLFERHTMIVL
jgi:hypothetical protein